MRRLIVIAVACLGLAGGVSSCGFGQPGWSGASHWAAFSACVIAHESGGDPTAQNPGSSASGLFQDLDSTWGGYDGYLHAKDAPVWMQYDRNYLIWQQFGSAPWRGTGCT